MKRFLLIGFLFILLGCLPQVESHLPVRLRLAGSTAMGPLMQELADAYQQERGYVSFDIQAVGSKAGLDALEAGFADVALVSRGLSQEEKQKWQEALIAWDALAIAVHEENPVRSLTLEQVRAIFTGEIISWAELGGRQEDIQVVAREEGAGSRLTFEELVLEGSGRITSTALILPTDQGGGEYVAQNPAAIGYTSLALLPPGAVAVDLEGQAAAPESTYPLLRPFFLVFPREADPEILSFMAFCLSPQGQALVAENYLRAR